MAISTPESRLLAKVNQTETCWIWSGGQSKSGFGRIYHERKVMRAHVLAHVLWIGPVPVGECVLQRCGDHLCVRPDHLYLGSLQTAIRAREQRKPWRRKRQEETREVVRKAKSHPCADCGVQYPYYVMQFDHRPGEVKNGDITRMVRRKGIAAIVAEIAKCDIVCANCHAGRSYRRQRGGSMFDQNIRLTFRQQDIITTLIKLGGSSSSRVATELAVREEDITADLVALRMLGLTYAVLDEWRYVGGPISEFEEYLRGRGIKDGNDLLPVQEKFAGARSRGRQPLDFFLPQKGF